MTQPSSTGIATPKRWRGKPQPRLTAGIIVGVILLFGAGLWASREIERQVAWRASEWESDQGAAIGLDVGLGLRPETLPCEKIIQATDIFFKSAVTPEVLLVGIEAQRKAVANKQCGKDSLEKLLGLAEARLDQQPWALRHAKALSVVWPWLRAVAEDHARVRKTLDEARKSVN